MAEGLTKKRNIIKTLKDLSLVQKLVIIASASGLILLAMTLMFLLYSNLFQSAVILSLMLMGLPYIFYRYWEYRRVRKIEKYFPDYLRDVSESLRAGMPLPKAIESGAKGNYGPLSKEMKKTAAQISWGIPFTEAMQQFADRSKSSQVNRAVTIIVESHKSGGNIAEVLETVSRDVRRTKTLRTKRKSKLKVYLLSIYFIFFLFLGIMSALTVSFIPATPDLNKAAAVTGGTPSDMSPGEFKTFFFHLALIEAIFAGLIGGQMGTGHLLSGVKHSVIMVIITIIILQVVLAPPGFKDTVAEEIVKLPPNTEGFESSSSRLSVKKSVTTEEIAKLVREKAEEQDKKGFEKLRGEDIRFIVQRCIPCQEEALEISPREITVNRPSDLSVKVTGRGGGEYDIQIGKSPGGGGGRGASESLRG